MSSHLYPSVTRSTDASEVSSSVWTKPKTAGYSLKGILALSRRVLRPPPAGVPMVATVGSLNLRPAYDVKIEDMLSAKYLPPLGLRDFEEWLLFTEHSAENLYFVQWLDEYTARYQNGSWNESQLWFSFLRAKASFFTPQGSLELNLPHGILRDVAAITFSSRNMANDHSSIPGSAHPRSSISNESDVTETAGRAPTPDELAAAKEHVLKMLSVSLAKFARDATSNAGILRRFYCGSAGLGFIGAGLVPVLVSTLLDYHRYIRLLSFPLFWVGGILILCAYAKICLVIYFWGDFRQLRGYELELPTIADLVPVQEKGRMSSDSHQYPPSSVGSVYPPTVHSWVDHDDEEDTQDIGCPSHKTDVESAQEANAHVSLSSPQGQYKVASENPQATDNLTSPRSVVRRRAPPIPLHLPRSPATAYGFDWDAPPLSAAYSTAQHTKKDLSPTSLIFASSHSPSHTSLTQMSEKVTPIFAPLTRVINPLIVRGMAEVVRRSTFWGGVFAFIGTAVCLVVPSKGHSWGHGW